MAKRNYRSLVLVGCIHVLLLASGCSGGEQPHASIDQPLRQDTAPGAQGLLPEEDRFPVEPRLPEDWVGHRVNASPGEWRYAGEIVLAPDGARPSSAVDVPDGSADEPLVANPTVILADLTSRSMYEIALPENDRSRLTTLLEELGFHLPSGEENSDPSEDEDALVAKSWSDNTDNRIRLGIGAGYAATNSTYNKIGTLKPNGGGDAGGHVCTGTFVGSADSAPDVYVMTAAHCLWDQNGNQIDVDFVPRQDGCETEPGTPIAGCDQSPYGIWDAQQYLYYSYFASTCAGGGLDDECKAHDIALIRVTPEAGATYPGAKGVARWTKTSLDSIAKYHRGYPGCGAGVIDPPAVNCLARTLYGDGSFSIDGGYKLLNGWPRYYKFSSDTNPGHSGGPTYASNVDGKFVFGVDSAGCSNDCGTSRPNKMRAIDAHWYDEILYFMSL